MQTMSREIINVEITESQINYCIDNRKLILNDEGRETKDFILECSISNYVLVIEKPKEIKLSKIKELSKNGIIAIASNPDKGESKNQQGTNIGSCYLKENRSDSMAATYVKYPRC